MDATVTEKKVNKNWEETTNTNITEKSLMYIVGVRKSETQHTELKVTWQKSVFLLNKARQLKRRMARLCFGEEKIEQCLLVLLSQVEERIVCRMSVPILNVIPREFYVVIYDW